MKTKLRSMALVLLGMMLSVNYAWGATTVYSTGFEDCSTGTNYKSTVNYTAESANGASWTVYYGTVSTSSKIAGSKSMHMRLYNDNKAAYLVQTSNITNVDSIRFTYAVSKTAVKFDVLYSSDEGANWTKLASVSPSVTSATTLEYRLSKQVAKFRLKLLVTGGWPSKDNNTFRVDDINYFSTASTKTTVTLTAGDGGSVEAYSDNSYAEAKKITVTNNKFDVDQNSTVYFKAIPQNGKEVDSWSGATADSGDKNKASLEVGTATEKTVSVSFKSSATCQSSITITKGTESNGTFTLSQTGTVCIDDGNATISVTNIQPAEHYHFDEITTSVSGSVDNENKQVTNISESTTIAVVFTPDPTYTITFVDGVHNTTCTSFNMTDVYAGTQIVFNSIADKTPASPTGDCMADHYHFVGWVESGVEPKENPSNVIAAGTTSINVTKTVTYKAVWAQEKTE